MSLRQWIDSHAVGFESVPFAVYGPAQWTSEALTVTRRVPGGNAYVTQYLGRGPETVTYDLAFASIDEFHHLKTLLGTSGVLTLAADVAAVPDRVSVVLAGESYDRLADTVLIAVDSVEYQNGGIVRCQATFQREPVDAPVVIRVGG